MHNERPSIQGKPHLSIGNPYLFIFRLI